MGEQRPERLRRNVGLIGLGSMGSEIARRLLAEGFTLGIYNRTAEKAKAFAACGARPAQTPKELAIRSDVVLTIVTDDAAVRAVTVGAEGAFLGARPGTTFIDISTIAVSATRELAAEAERRGFHWLDAPTLGSPQAAGVGELAFVVGGSRAVLDCNRDVLEAVGNTIVWMGGNGLGQAAKIVHNLACGISLMAYGEALRLGDGLGLSRAQTLEVLLNGPLASTLLRMKAPKFEQNQYVPTTAPLVNMSKDLTLACTTAQALNLHLTTLIAAKEAYDRAKALGLEREDTSSVIKILGAP